jgi:predicted ATP-dependent serine protease
MVDVERSWQPVDLSAILAGTYAPPKPVVGRRSDGIGLFYPAKVHTVASASEAGKTWLLLAAVFDEIKAGNHGVYIDFEDSEEGIVGRLLTLGLSADAIRDQFHYIRPTQPVSAPVHLTDLFETVETYQPTLAVIDGITEAMTPSLSSSPEAPAH